MATIWLKPPELLTGTISTAWWLGMVLISHLQHWKWTLVETCNRLKLAQQGRGGEGVRVATPDPSGANSWVGLQLLQEAYSHLFRLILTLSIDLTVQTSDPGPSRPVNTSVLPCPSTHLAVRYCPAPAQTLSTWRCPAPLLPALQFSLYPQIFPRASGPELHPSGCSSGSAPPSMKVMPLFWQFPHTYRTRASPLLCNMVHNCPGPAYLSSPVLYIPPPLLNTLAIYLSPR